MAPERIGPEDHQAVGESEEFLSLQEKVSLAAKTNRPVILIGERGTGKELAAARLHLLSERWNGPYITLNCAALSPTLIESELFGHEAGAFTGAVRQRKGRFELADGGTLFLDEIANTPITAQEKILRVVEYGEVERVGGTSTMRVDVRLIAATNVDLRKLAARGRFRQDLLDRLSFEVITLPPLRRRGGDILLLAGHFARRMAAELEFERAPAFSDRAQRSLMNYPWPGNIRELKNVVERMVYRSAGETIDEVIFDPFDSDHTPPEEHLPGVAEVGEKSKEERLEATDYSDTASPNGSSARETMDQSLDGRALDQAVKEYEVRRIREALQSCQFNQRKAADELGLTYHQFRGYYRKYRDEFVS